MLSVLSAQRQLASTGEQLKPRIEGGNCDAVEEHAVTISVVRPSRSTGGLRPESEVGRGE
jgi:hypothetical protein